MIARHILPQAYILLVTSLFAAMLFSTMRHALHPDIVHHDPLMASTLPFELRLLNLSSTHDVSLSSLVSLPVIFSYIPTSVSLPSKETVQSSISSVYSAIPLSVSLPDKDALLSSIPTISSTFYSLPSSPSIHSLKLHAVFESSISSWPIKYFTSTSFHDNTGINDDQNDGDDDTFHNNFVYHPDTHRTEILTRFHAIEREFRRRLVLSPSSEIHRIASVMHKLSTYRGTGRGSSRSTRVVVSLVGLYGMFSALIGFLLTPFLDDDDDEDDDVGTGNTTPDGPTFTFWASNQDNDTDATRTNGACREQKYALFRSLDVV